MTEEMLSQNFDRQAHNQRREFEEYFASQGCFQSVRGRGDDDKMLITSMAAIIRNSDGSATVRSLSSQRKSNPGGKSFTRCSCRAQFSCQTLNFWHESSQFWQRVELTTGRNLLPSQRMRSVAAKLVRRFSLNLMSFMSKGGSKNMAKTLKKKGIDVDASRYDLIGEDFTESRWITCEWILTDWTNDNGPI